MNFKKNNGDKIPIVDDVAREKADEAINDLAKLGQSVGDLNNLKTVDNSCLTNAVNELVDTKISNPEDAPVVGKVLKIKSVNEDGTFVCEWADGGSGGVSDVKIGDDSIVTDGVAVVPEAIELKQAGVVRFRNGSGMLHTTDGWYVSYATEGEIRNRSSGYFISSNRLDYIVKTAMCDGKGVAWTEAEQASARERLGIISAEGVYF